jgi:hypothetical protein
MSKPFILLAVLLATFGLSFRATAQAPRRPSPEIGAGISRMIPVYGDYSTDDLSEPTGHLRVTLPFATHFAFEGVTTIGRRADDYWTRTEGLFALQVQQRFRRAVEAPFQPFITYGGAGYYAHVTQHEVRRNGVLVSRHGSFNEIDPPLATLFGAGIQQRLGRHITVRAEAQLLTLLYLPLGYAFSTSASIPLR